MKNLFLLFLLINCSFKSYGQHVMSHQQISQEAYFDCINKGYTANDWPQNQSQYVEDCKKQKFNSSYGGGGYQRKTTNVAGLI